MAHGFRPKTPATPQAALERGHGLTGLAKDPAIPYGSPDRMYSVQQKWWLAYFGEGLEHEETTPISSALPGPTVGHGVSHACHGHAKLSHPPFPPYSSCTP